jgi:hypothetical protein
MSLYNAPALNGYEPIVMFFYNSVKKNKVTLQPLHYIDRIDVTGLL